MIIRLVIGTTVLKIYYSRSRSRQCTAPQHGGKDCSGTDDEREECESEECPRGKSLKSICTLALVFINAVIPITFSDTNNL